MPQAIIYKNDIEVARIEADKYGFQVLAFLHTQTSTSAFEACTTGDYAIKWPTGVRKYPNRTDAPDMNHPPCTRCGGGGTVIYPPPHSNVATIAQVCASCLGTGRDIT